MRVLYWRDLSNKYTEVVTRILICWLCKWLSHQTQTQSLPVARWDTGLCKPDHDQHWLFQPWIIEWRNQVQTRQAWLMCRSTRHGQVANFELSAYARGQALRVCVAGFITGEGLRYILFCRLSCVLEWSRCEGNGALQTPFDGHCCIHQVDKGQRCVHFCTWSYLPGTAWAIVWLESLACLFVCLVNDLTNSTIALNDRFYFPSPILTCWNCSPLRSQQKWDSCCI